jgi:flagellar biosynthetic protein FliQ
VGLIIALFQALTQLKEMTLVFVPKIVVVFGALIFFLQFMISTLSNYMNNLADRIIGLS